MSPLSLITGPPSSLDRALADEIRACKAADPLAPVTVLVGGSLLRPFLRARLADLLDGHINVNVLTPAELALRLGEPALIAGDRLPITPLADRALAEEIARGARSYFEPVNEAPGFANALHRLFGELRAALDRRRASSRQQPQPTTAPSWRSSPSSTAATSTARGPFYDAGDAMAAAPTPIG